MDVKKLSASEISVFIDPREIEKLSESLDFAGVIGQPRALKALRIGTEIKADGYNIFVSGTPGTGRMTAVSKVIDEYRKNNRHRKKDLRDIVYVFNFKNPDRPLVLYFSPGRGRIFKKDIHTIVEKLKNTIQLKIESEIYKKEREAITIEIEKRENHVLSEFESRLSKDNLRIVYIDGASGEQTTDIHPLFENRTVSFDELQVMVASGKITEKEWNRLREKYYLYMDEMKEIFNELKQNRISMEEELNNHVSRIAEPIINNEVDILSGKYKGEKVRKYFSSFKKDAKENLYLFLNKNTVTEKGFSGLLRYGVNIIEDNSETMEVPVIFENNPAASNLFGSIESAVEIGGEIRTNFLMIRAGSLIRASGGFLILRAEDIFSNEDIWNKLKRVLQSGRVEIQYSYSSQGRMGGGLKPEAVKVDLKLVIIGNNQLYDTLYNQDPDFRKLFKISAEFDHVMTRTSETTKQYISFIHKLTGEKPVKKISYDGIAAIIKHGISLAGRKDLLSTRFSRIADIIREADYWAEKNNEKIINASSVKKAIREHKYLYNLPEEKIGEQILRGTVMLDVTGSKIGKINGLAVHDRGYYSFGVPLVISARISPGDGSIINIEKESGLSGEIHDKGVFILEGLLRSRYARTFPLSIRASICFEQSYSEIDGDSASSAEFYALISAISNLPIHQNIAVTGSINQMGEIQAIGGVTEKVTGFYNICSRPGLTGLQGVIIPIHSVNNLILSEEIIEAVEKNKFSIYPIRTVNEGMEILFGIEAGNRTKRGDYPSGSINGITEKRLKEMALKAKAHG